MSLITFGGQQITSGGQVVLAPLDTLKIPNLKILVSAKRQAIQADNTVNSTLKNWTGLGDGTGSNIYQTNVIGSNPAIACNGVDITFPNSLVLAGESLFTSFIHIKTLIGSFVNLFLVGDATATNKAITIASGFEISQNIYYSLIYPAISGVFETKTQNFPDNIELTIGITHNTITGETKHYFNGILLGVGFFPMAFLAPNFIGIFNNTQKYLNVLHANTILTDIEMMQLHVKATQTGMI